MQVPFTFGPGSRLTVRANSANRRVSLIRIMFIVLGMTACTVTTHAQDLLVSSFGSDQVLRYNGVTGEFIEVFASGGGTEGPLGLICHSDGNLYVAGYHNDQVVRYDNITGEFIDVFASGGGLEETEEVLFGPDGNLYVSSFDSDQVLRYDGTTGAFIDVFASGGGLNGPSGLAFGADGHLYVGGFNSDNIVRYNGTTGEFIDVFASGPELNGTEGILFAPGGDLLVASFNTDQVLRYDDTDGSFSGVYASGGGLDGPVGITFGPDGNFYVAAWNSNQVYRFNSATGAFMDVFTSGGGLSEAAFPVFCHTDLEINAGINDAWVSEGAPFQGYFFTVFEQIKALFVAQFTFDSVLPTPPDTAVFGAWDQRWATGLGMYSGNSVTVNMELTTGGIFNGPQPKATQEQGYGTLTITFTDCNNATLVYNFPGLGLSGQVKLHRVLPSNIQFCKMLNAIRP